MAKKVQKTKKSAKNQKICLCMIVKNEANVIIRCLESAKPVIDYVSICDTGSTDDTVALIENWCVENNIPGTVHYEPFKNFGYNRSVSAELTKKAYPDADYLLLLDADMILEVNDSFDKANLEHDHYMILQYNDALEYWNVRLIKTSLPWKAYGVTHEYWDVDDSKVNKKRVPTKGKLFDLKIDDQEDGGSKDKKFKRDKQLLLEGILDLKTPADLKVRYLFYLGQTLCTLEEYKESIQWYKQRIKAGGWDEEVFYSFLKIGCCYEQLAYQVAAKREQKTQEAKENESLLAHETINLLVEEEEQYVALATVSYMKAWQSRPQRAEPLYRLAKLYREQANYHVALMYAVKGKEIPFPKEDFLFVDNGVYHYLLDFEISVSAYYVEEKREIGRVAQQCLQAKINQLPDYIAVSVKDNAKFY